MGRDPAHGVAARDFGHRLAARGIGLVYGGGSVGLMGELAAAVHEAGGEVTGIIPEALQAREGVGRTFGTVHVVDTMHRRKAMMAELADGFVALPGGIGTFEELFEAWTWAQLGYHDKPCGLLDVAGFYGGMAAFLDHVAAEGFLQPAHREMLLVERDAERLIDRMLAYRAPEATRWITGRDV